MIHDWLYRRRRWQLECLRDRDDTSVVEGGNGTVFLLACRVPDLEFDGFVFIVGMDFGEEGGSKSGVISLVKSIENKTHENTTFTHT
jgi:hypothetical protein